MNEIKLILKRRAHDELFICCNKKVPIADHIKSQFKLLHRYSLSIKEPNSP